MCQTFSSTINNSISFHMINSFRYNVIHMFFNVQIGNTSDLAARLDCPELAHGEQLRDHSPHPLRQSQHCNPNAFSIKRKEKHPESQTENLKAKKRRASWRSHSLFPELLRTKHATHDTKKRVALELCNYTAIRCTANHSADCPDYSVIPFQEKNVKKKICSGSTFQGMSYLKIHVFDTGLLLRG